MLMKPPSIFEDLVSQDSENYTVRSKQQSNKNKPRKENTIRIGGASAEQRDMSNEKERDNQSVHSNGSKRSKDKRAKESTLARPKVSESFHKDEDTHSVYSTGSRHSQKSAKKQNNIMQRPKIQQHYSKPKLPQENKLSFKNAIGDPEESVIKRYRLEDDEQLQPVRYTEQRVKEPEAKIKNKKFAPFAELEHRQGSQEQIPIFIIEQPKNIKQQVVGLTRPEQYKRALKEQPKEIITELRQIAPEQSRSLFDQSRMANTKSVRRPIFGREELSNNSKVSNIDQSNISAMQSTSRRKSNSKLRQLFNNSRQKVMEQSSIQNESKMSFQIHSQSRAVKPTVGNQRMVQLERKVIEDNQFGVESIKSGLDLTVSNNQHVERESLIFQFEPERKKGMTVTSKNKNLNSSEQQLLKIGGQLTSTKPKNIKQTPANLPQLQTGNIQSKDLKRVDTLLKENEQFLRNSVLLNLSSSDKLKRDSGDDYLFKLEDDDMNADYMLQNNALNTPWNQIRQQEPLNIKKVERNEKPQIKSRQVGPIKIQKEEKVQQKPRAKVETKVNTQPKRVKEQQLPMKQLEYLKKPQVKQQISKSPGKISKNFESTPYEADNKSENSNKSAKKAKNVKQSAIPRTKAHKIQIKNDGPRGDQSFYEQQIKQKIQQPSIDDLSLYSKKPEIKQQKKPNVFRFSDDQNEVSEKPKSRTDINFYDNQARSNKPPSSRPPLSGKSNRSRSTSKDKVPKQTTLKIGNVQPADKNAFKKQAQPAPVTKKLTLMERAMIKHNESGQDDRSQESFSSREDFSQNSRKSSNSRGSRKSIKQNSIKIDRKEGSLVKNRGLPPYQRKNSSNQSSHEQDMQRVGERQRSIEDPRNNMVVPNQRAIVSKNCTFIDERGRLVQQDLIIKGKDVYGQNRIDDSTTQAFERMRRTKESHRSRSRSRESRGQRRRSRDEGQSSSYQNSSYCSSFYQNSSYGRNPPSKPAPYNHSYGSGNQPQALREFMKPVEQVPLYNQSHNERRSQKEISEAPRTFNDIFGKKTKQNYNQDYGQSSVSNFSESRSRRSLKRTQTSAKKR